MGAPLLVNCHSQVGGHLGKGWIIKGQEGFWAGNVRLFAKGQLPELADQTENNLFTWVLSQGNEPALAKLGKKRSGLSRCGGGFSQWFGGQVAQIQHPEDQGGEFYRGQFLDGNEDLPGRSIHIGGTDFVELPGRQEFV